MDEATRKFTKDVRAIVNRAMPGLIAAELNKLERKASAARRVIKTGTEFVGKPPLQEAVKKHGSIRAAARALGMPRSTFLGRLNKEMAAGSEESTS